MGMSARTVRDAAAEGEKLGWWTRIHERTRSGGIMLTFRLHFPEFAGADSPVEADWQPVANGVPVGAIIDKSPVEAERKPSGSPVEAQWQPAATGRVEGSKVGRDEGSFALASEAPTASKAKTPKPPKTNCITNPPTLADFIARFAEVGTSSDEEAERCWHYYADNGWRMSNGKPLVNWRQSAGTWARAHPAKPSTPKFVYTPPPKLKYDDFGRVIK